MSNLQLTREQVIEEHREMWNWIADETERRRKVVTKDDYLEEHGGFFLAGFVPVRNCYLCQYADCDCDKCIADWTPCVEEGSLYDEYYNAIHSYKLGNKENENLYSKQINIIVTLARKIANVNMKEADQNE